MVILLAFLLAATGGYTDAVSYLTLHLFVAAMSGTMVLVGIGLAQQQASLAASRCGVVLTFFAGLVIARWLRRKTHGRASPPLLLSAAVMAVSALLWPDFAAAYPMAFAMGCQNGAVTHFGVLSLNTAFITGDMEQLAEALTTRGPRQAHLIAGAILCYGGGAAAGAVAHGALSQPMLPAAGALVLAAVLARGV